MTETTQQIATTMSHGQLLRLAREAACDMRVNSLSDLTREELAIFAADLRKIEEYDHELAPAA